MLRQQQGFKSGVHSGKAKSYTYGTGFGIKHKEEWLKYNR